MRVALLICLGVLTVAGCDWGAAGGDQMSGSSPHANATKNGKAAAELVGPRLAAVRDELGDDYAIKVVAYTKLPTRKALDPRPGDDIPGTLKPVEGLRAALPDGQTGFVLGYRSHDLAQAAASSLLIRGPVFGVRGCGRIIYFSESRNPSGARWQREVASSLSPCRPGEFLTIE